MINRKWAILKFKLIPFLLVAGGFFSCIADSILAIDSVSQMLDQDEKNRKPCKDYSLTELNTVMNKYVGIDHKNWRLQYKDKASITIEGYELELYACVDVDNEGIAEVILLHNLTGGMKCCHIMSIYKYDNGNLKHIGNFGDGDSGRSTRAAFIDLNKDGIKEIISFKIVDYLDDMPGAYSPELPLIYCFKQNKITECTEKFPQVIEREVQETLKRREQILNKNAELARKYGPKNDFSDLKGNALQYLFLYDLLGKKKEKEGWIGLRKYYPQVYDEIKKEYGE